MYPPQCVVASVIFVALYWKHILSLQVIPERITITNLNEKYIYKNATFNVRRYGRKSDYYMNMVITIKMEYGNNVSANLIFYEYLHNEYKRSFVEMKFERLCDFVYRDPWVGKGFMLAGLYCPLSPGTHRLMNISIPSKEFPNVWPFERCKVEVTVLQNQNKDIIGSADVYVAFKQKPRI